MICRGSAKYSNKFLKYQVANKSASYMIYVNAINLYGHSMTQLFQTEIQTDFNLDNYSNKSSRGCFLEVNLVYPDEQHGFCNVSFTG